MTTRGTIRVGVNGFGVIGKRVVSCNTTSVVRTLTALKRAGLLVSARGTLMRRATDPWESHLGGIMNTVVPEPEVPSHQAIVIPETIDAIRAVCATERDPARSIRRTNEALGIRASFLKSTNAAEDLP